MYSGVAFRCVKKHFKQGARQSTTSTLPPPPTYAQKRVVVTGMGLVTPLGCTVQGAWTNLLAGKSGVKVTDRYDPSLPVKIVAEGISNVSHSNPEVGDHWQELPKQVRAGIGKNQLPLFVSYAVAAAQQAIEDSGWDGDREMAGVAVGNSIASPQDTIEDYQALVDKGFRGVSPYSIPRILANIASGYISILHNLQVCPTVSKTYDQGPNHTVSTACATGAHAIGDAASFIQRGMATAMLVGSTEGGICSHIIAGFARARALASTYNENPEAASRPFDADRSGFVMGEGSGMLFLEEYESAIARGAKIYGELRGYGLSGDAYHITQPTADGKAAQRCMKMALMQSGLSPDEIGYINAHATSTPIGDVAEVNAITAVFGDRKDLSISSTKSSTGHLLGGAGSVEAIFSLLALQNGILPPTINLDKLDPALNPNFDYVPHVPKEKKIRAVISNSFGFGGTNASLLFSKV